MSDNRFPEELVGRPTSEVLKHLSEKFRGFAEDVGGSDVEIGYHYASSWLHNWMKDAERVEADRCHECANCMSEHGLLKFQYDPKPNDPWYCQRCGHTVRQH